ncbi:MAG: hypothetical protein ACYC5J_09885 [Chloroflexota bacterium]
MNGVAPQIEQYLWETLGIHVVLHPWDRSNGLPHYLRERYHLFRTNLLGTECLLMIDAWEGEHPPGVVGMHLEQIRSRSGMEAVYVRPAITSYNRKRLIERKIPFIVPGNQMYLPMLGIDLREHLKRLREKRTLFSPSTQVLVLYVLWKKTTETITPTGMAERLGYSAMTLTRAFDELETAGIGEQTTLGKERQLRFVETGRQLWEEALPYLGSPVRRRLFASAGAPLEGGQLAGQSALARYTMLAEPRVPVFAFSSEAWKAKVEEGGVSEIPLPEPDGYQIELWRYLPEQFAQEGIVDRLSLYLSLREVDDERVQAALDELLGGMKW